MPFLQQQARGTFTDFGIAEPLALDEYQTRGGLRGLVAAQSLSPEAIIERMPLAIRGRGGAAFPAWGKWQIAQQTNALVCLAVWLCREARSVADKILATAFVACGFEHSVANMYFLPVGVVLAAGISTPL